MKSHSPALIFSTLLLSACGQNTANVQDPQSQKTEIKSPAAPTSSLTVPLINNAKETIGVVTVDTSESGSVRLRVQAGSIPAGEHGMHFHQKADCSSPDFKSAGGHINPMKVQHGLKNPNGPDNADMENAVANADNNIMLERINDRVSLTGGAGLPALLDADGSALVIHENPDDQITQPIGGAGARIACAEIRQ